MPTTIQFQDATGEFVTVSADHPLPTAGGAGGGGMTPADISATAPATWDAATAKIGVATGTTPGTVAAGNDSRLSNARTPTAHAATHASGGTDPLTLSGAQITTGTVPVDRLPTGPGANQVAIGSHTHTGLMTGTPTAIPDVAAAPTMEEFNVLLAALRLRNAIS